MTGSPPFGSFLAETLSTASVSTFPAREFLAETLSTASVSTVPAREFLADQHAPFCKEMHS